MAFTISLAGFSVFLTEPSEMQANIVTRFLEHQGVTKLTVMKTGSETLAALDNCVPEYTIVVSSLYLPDMQGTDLVEKMRANDNFEKIPFILISSETRPQKLEPVRQSGACSILAKPFGEQELARALYAAADSLSPPDFEVDEEVEALHLLLVDDSLAARRYMRRILEEIGITRIDEATNGQEAIAYLQENMVDMVITDYNMPEMDGLGLTEYIRKESWQTDIPILMVTSEENQGRLAAVECAGVSAICDKPFESANVRKLINNALQR